MRGPYFPIGFPSDNEVIFAICFVSFAVSSGVGSDRQREVALLPPGVKAYCQSEFLNITCDKDEVILMESARYGRMRAGRCVTGSYGYLGCSVDVLWYFNRICSGYSHCKIHTMDPILHRTEPCPKDLSSYLEAKHQCVTASTGDKQSCWNHGYTRLLPSSGYLASLISVEQGFGSKDCPWRLLALPGQRLKFILMAFGGLRPQAVESKRTDGVVQPAGEASSGSVCYEVGSVTEGANVSPLKVCAGDFLETPSSSGQSQTDQLVVYLSEGPNVTVYFHTQQVLKELAEFLLKYETFGCPTMLTPPGGWIKMDRGNLLIGCNGLQEVWHLSCAVDGTWTGQRPNCSHDGNSGLDSNTDAIVQEDEPFPLGVLLVVAIGVSLGVFLGGVLLSVVSIFMRRNNSHNDRTPIPATTSVATDDAELLYDDATIARPRHVIRCSHPDDCKMTMTSVSNCPHVTTLIDMPYLEPAVCSCLIDGRQVWMSDVDWPPVVTS